MNAVAAVLAGFLLFAVGYGLMMTGITFSCGIILPAVIGGLIVGAIVR